MSRRPKDDALRLIGFRLPERTIRQLKDIQTRDGIGLSEQARRAFSWWVEQRTIEAEILSRAPAGRRRAS